VKRQAGEQFEEHYAERVHICRRRNGLAGELFRRGVVGRERRGSQFRCGPGNGIQQLGDTEVQKLHSPFRRDEDVARFQVAMNHQAAVSAGDDIAHFNEQSQPRAQVELPSVAELREADAFHVLHDHVRAAVGMHAAIEQAGDAGVLQAGEDFPLCLKARDLRDGASLQHLDGGLLLERAVCARGQVHLAGAAPADQVQQSPRPQARAFGQITANLLYLRGHRA
jgi:hypothetical protein